MLPALRLDQRRSARALLIVALAWPTLAAPMLAAPMQAAANIPQIPFQELSLRDALADPFAAPTLVRVRASRSGQSELENIELALRQAPDEVVALRNRTLQDPRQQRSRNPDYASSAAFGTAAQN